MSKEETNFNVCNIYQQRKVTSVYNTPLPRFELVSPYPNFTQYQLDMRRKVEILKYNNQPSKAPKYTKKMQYSRTLRGLNKIYPPAAAVLNCPNNDYVPTPSYKSGIPGPNITLTFDPNVPLYNYTSELAKNIESQSQLSIIYSPTKLLSYYTNDNIITYQAISTKIFTLLMSETINKPYYIFSFNTPIGIYIDGSYYYDAWFRYSIVSATLDVYYQGKIVQINKMDYQSSLNSLPYNLDISFVYVNQSDVSYNVPVYFQACQFVGNLSFSNIFLYAQPGYVYDFNLNIIIKPTLINGTIVTQFNPTNFYTICNFNNDSFINNNCTTKNSIPGLSSMPFTVNTTFI